MKQWLEMEIGITGGEEDGVNNEDVDNNSWVTCHNLCSSLLTSPDSTLRSAKPAISRDTAYSVL